MNRKSEKERKKLIEGKKEEVSGKERGKEKESAKGSKRERGR